MNIDKSTNFILDELYEKCYATFQHCMQKVLKPYERYVLDITVRRYIDYDINNINNNEHNIKLPKN